MTALGLKQRPGGDAEDSLLSALRSRRMLLILDNCEHVVETAGRLAENIAANCPNVTVLATSRQRLAVAGEQCWPVEPLSLHEPDSRKHTDGPRSPAVQLFLDRAASADPGFADHDRPIVTEICERLDGVPLAIELAAVRVSALGSEEVRGRLGDRFRLLAGGPRGDRRHRNLGAVIDWSYDLLTEAERTVFARLSVFAGSFGLDAAEDVCAGGDIDRAAVAGLVAELVDASLVVRDRSNGATRLRLLETLRQYAAERLDERGETESVCGRFVRHFVDLAEEAEPHIRGSDEAHWVTVLDQELDNLRAAHEHATSRHNVDQAVRLVAGLHYYAHFRLRDEVTTWAETTLALPAADRHPRRSAALAAAAEGAGTRGDLARAAELADAGIATASSQRWRSLISLYETQAVVALYEGRLDEAFTYAQRAYDLAVPRGEHFHATFALLHQVLARVYGGDRSAATELAVAAQAAAERSGNPTQRAWAAYAWGEVLGDADVEQALLSFDDAIATAERVGNVFAAGVARVSVSTLRSRHSDARSALQSFREVIDRWHQLNDWTHQWTTLRNLLHLLIRLCRDDEAAVLYGAIVHAGSGADAFGADSDRLTQAAETLTRRLGAARFDEAVARGAVLHGDDVVGAACRDIDRARRLMSRCARSRLR